MATRTGMTRSIGARTGITPHAAGSQDAGTQMVAANEQLDTNDVVAVRASALLEQLLAMRFELTNGVVPSAQRGVLTKNDLDYMRVQLDAAIASTRGIVATCGAAPVSIVRQRDFWRSEEVPATKA